MTKPRDLEGPVQRAIIETVRIVAPGVDIRHIPNGGLRNARVAANLKRNGVVRGTPDLMLILSSGDVAFIEVKAHQNDRLTPEQEAFWDLCKSRGVKICKMWDAALVSAQLHVWGEPVKDARFFRTESMP